MKLTVALRNKTTRKLSSSTCAVLRDVISQTLCLESHEMEKLIWSMTYTPVHSAQQLGFSNSITPSEVLIIRSELCNIYRKYHPNWAYGHRCTPSTSAENALLKALKGDQYAYDTVMSHIDNRMQRTKDEVCAILRRLNSKVETSQFGGVRSLGFNYDEAVFLKVAANQMGQVMEPLAKAS